MLETGVLENIPCYIKDLIHIDDHLKIGPINRPQLNNDIKGFPCGSAGQETACNGSDLGSVSGLGGSHFPIPGLGKATHYSILARRIPWIV